MIDTKKIEQLAKHIHESLPQGLRDFGDDIEKKIKQSLQNQLNKLDLISREEFDLQTRVLLRTREKLEKLEQRMSILETRLALKTAHPLDTSEFDNEESNITEKDHK